MQKTAVNCCLLFIAYNLYTFLKQYNTFFINARQKNKFEELDLDGPINKE